LFDRSALLFLLSAFNIVGFLWGECIGFSQQSMSRANDFFRESRFRHFVHYRTKKPLLFGTETLAHREALQSFAGIIGPKLAFDGFCNETQSANWTATRVVKLVFCRETPKIAGLYCI